MRPPVSASCSTPRLNGEVDGAARDRSDGADVGGAGLGDAADRVRRRGQERRAGVPQERPAPARDRVTNVGAGLVRVVDRGLQRPSQPQRGAAVEGKPRPSRVRSLLGWSDPWFAHPESYRVMRPDPAANRLDFQLLTRGRGTALLLELDGATAATRDHGAARGGDRVASRSRRARSAGGEAPGRGRSSSRWATC